MRKTVLILMAVMVVLASIASISAQTDKYIEPAAIKAFENNDSIAEIWVTYSVDSPINESNEWDMMGYYRNITISKLAFSYIPENEMNITKAALSAFRPSFVAIATKDGFEELSNDSRVISIYLEKKAYLADSSIENNTNASENQTLPSVDSAILAAFEQNQTWVRVDVILADSSNITIHGTKEERRNLSMQRDEWLRSMAVKILFTLSENESKNINEIVGAFSIDVTREGFDKLSTDSRISAIALAYNVPGYGATNVSITENQTEIKTPDVVKPQSFFQKIISFFKSLFNWK